MLGTVCNRLLSVLPRKRNYDDEWARDFNILSIASRFCVNAAGIVMAAPYCFSAAANAFLVGLDNIGSTAGPDGAEDSRCCTEMASAISTRTRSYFPIL